MPWLLFLLAAAALALAWWTPSMALMVACLLLALGLVLAATVSLHARRVAARREVAPKMRLDEDADAA